jgi:UDP-2-acetamido-3-amino-2,3-dideoxy-glucuronate N-acetyltransferase
VAGLREFCRIADDVVLGEDVQIHAFVNLYGCRIGDGTRLGTFVEVQKGAVIGRRCKISSHTFICEGVEIEDEVFVGHGVMFTNTMLPRATNATGELQSETDWELLKTRIGRHASIGSGSVILCGISIGHDAVIGAGAVVTKSIPPGEIWVGNPARFLKKVGS